MVQLQGGATESCRALEQLCQLYWYPVYAFVRRSGNGPHDAEDLTQSFFSMVLSLELFARADDTKGKLRSFLLTALKRFLGQQREKSDALRRGGGVRPISIDVIEAEKRYEIEAKDQLSPDAAFEKRWALTVIDSALARLGEEQRAKGRERHWSALQPFLAWNAGAGSQEDSAAELGITIGAFRAALLRLRRRFRVILTEEISHTILESDVDGLDGEIAYLFRVLSK